MRHREVKQLVQGQTAHRSKSRLSGNDSLREALLEYLPQVAAGFPV